MDGEEENDVEIYFVPPEQDEENNTEEEMSFDSFPNLNQSSDSDENVQFLDLIQVEQNEDSNQTDHTNEDMEANASSSNQPTICYNRNLPATHSYLGNDFEELNGRIVLEEESIVTIPLLCLPGVCVIPNQLLPLQFEGSYFLTTIKNIIDGNKIFGLVSNYNRNIGFKNVYNNVKLNLLGTVVEVRSYGTENDGTILKIKAEGRERFLIRETWTESNRSVMGKVFILPEEKSKHPFYKDIGLSSQGYRHNKKFLSACTPYANFVYDLYDPEYLMDKIRSHLNQWASFSTSTKSSNGAQSSTNVYENRTVSQTTGTNQPNLGESNNQEQTNVQSSNENATDAMQISNTNNNNNNSSSAIAAVQPVSVVSTRTVVTKIVPVRDSESEEDEENSEEHGFKAYAPSDPLEFSYWVTANLPLEDYQRLILLSFNHPVQRLRWQSNFFEKYLSLSCVSCDSHIFSMCDIFSMSVKGSTCYYQDVFVNPNGFIHDTLTVKEVKNVYLQGRKSSEFSWFPNYSWIIINCASCSHHLGWKFVANDKKLTPQSFFGISRRNVKPSIDKDNSDNTQHNPTI